MSIEPLYIFYAASFLCVLIGVEGLYYMVGDPAAQRKNINRRMKMLESGKKASEVYELLRRVPKAQTEFLGPVRFGYEWLDRLITQSGSIMSMAQFFLIIAVSISVLFIGALIAARVSTGFAFLAVPTTSFPLAVGIGIFGPIGYFMYLRAERRKLFGEQLPEALDVMIRSLQAGHPVTAAMSLVTKEMADPIGTEFGIAVDEMTYGMDLRTALENLSQRIDLPDFQYVVISISTQYETGGNLVEVLEGLARVIRERFRMFKKIRALSGEGRISALILSILPFITVGLIYTVNPYFYLNVMDDPIFMPAVLGVVGLMAFGIFIMYRLVNFKV